MGRTQLALRYWRHMKNKAGIFWLDASSRIALESSMVAVCKHLLPGRRVDNPRDGVDLVRKTLSNWRNPWLLVFDNFDDPDDIPDIIHFFPDSRRGRTLITSRSASSKELGAAIELDQMAKDEGVELLLRSSQTDTKDVAVVEKILAQLEYLPLTIDLVRAYISKQHLVDFEEEYKGGNDILWRKHQAYGNIVVHYTESQEHL